MNSVSTSEGLVRNARMRSAWNGEPWRDRKDRARPIDEKRRLGFGNGKNGRE
jgi:hypothetical protein